MKRSDLDPDYMKTLLNYDPLTGIMTWQPRDPSMFNSHNRVGRGTISAEVACNIWNKRWAGKIAGNTDVRGYIVIRIGAYQYKAHLLAWIYMTNTHPDRFIDHIDGNRGNTQWSNLRLATRGENNSNVGPRKNNSLGIKGIRQRPGGKFEARITSNGTVHYLGRFDSLETAIAAHSKAAKELHKDFARYPKGIV